MINRTPYLFIVAFVFLLVSFEVKAQTTYISLSSTRANPNIDMSSVTTAGDGITQKVDATQTLLYKYLDYTYNDYARIDVALTSGTIPNGMSITLKGATYTGSRGYATSYQTVTLSDTPIGNEGLLIYDIYNTNDKYNLTSLVTMTIIVNDYAALHPTTNQLTVTYTISTYLR